MNNQMKNSSSRDFLKQMMKKQQFNQDCQEPFKNNLDILSRTYVGSPANKLINDQNRIKHSNNQQINNYQLKSPTDAQKTNFKIDSSFSNTSGQKDSRRDSIRNEDKIKQDYKVNNICHNPIDYMNKQLNQHDYPTKNKSQLKQDKQLNLMKQLNEIIGNQDKKISSNMSALNRSDYNIHQLQQSPYQEEKHYQNRESSLEQKQQDRNNKEKLNYCNQASSNVNNQNNNNNDSKIETRKLLQQIQLHNSPSNTSLNKHEEKYFEGKRVAKVNNENQRTDNSQLKQMMQLSNRNVQMHQADIYREILNNSSNNINQKKQEKQNYPDINNLLDTSQSLRSKTPKICSNNYANSFNKLITVGESIHQNNKQQTKEESSTSFQNKLQQIQQQIQQRDNYDLQVRRYSPAPTNHQQDNYYDLKRNNSQNNLSKDKNRNSSCSRERIRDDQTKQKSPSKDPLYCRPSSREISESPKRRQETSLTKISNQSEQPQIKQNVNSPINDPMSSNTSYQKLFQQQQQLQHAQFLQQQNRQKPPKTTTDDNKIKNTASVQNNLQPQSIQQVQQQQNALLRTLQEKIKKSQKVKTNENITNNNNKVNLSNSQSNLEIHKQQIQNKQQATKSEPNQNDMQLNFSKVKTEESSHSNQNTEQNNLLVTPSSKKNKSKDKLFNNDLESTEKSKKTNASEELSVAQQKLNNFIDESDTSTTSTIGGNEDCLQKLNIQNLIELEINLFHLTYKKKLSELTASCKNYLNIISVENFEFLEKIQCQKKNQKTLTKMIILERICVIMMLYETLQAQEGDESNLNNIFHAILYVHSNFLLLFEIINEKIVNEQISGKKEIQNKIQNLLNERTKQKRRPQVQGKVEKLSVINSYNDIILPILKLIISQYQIEPYTSISKIVENLNTIPLQNATRSLIDCFTKIVQEMDKKVKETEKQQNNKQDDYYDENLPQAQAPYLQPNLQHQLTLVLDLDETLVHYQELDDGGQFLVRPYAEQFLEDMSEYFEIVIFTAALQDYADFILDIIDTKKKISAKLYRQHTVSNGSSYVKDLSKLGRDLSKVIIIDNMAENFQLQPDNGIYIQSWYGEPEDRALYDLTPLLKEIAKSKKYPDVRIALRKLRDKMLENIQKGISEPHLNLTLDA